ncbi:hypothetical protein HDV64DRAFT_261022 [Trichoderma sp. TUCIM 5745]
MPAGKPVLLYCIFPVVRSGSTGLTLDVWLSFFFSYERLMVDSAAYRWNRRACSLSSLWEERGGSPSRRIWEKM